MISPCELKINNWVFIELGLPGLQPHKITAQDIADYANGRITLDSVQPIPLTPELLIKCGLNERFFKAYKIKALDGEKWKGQYGLFINNKWEATRFQYLHQLQNLYFALTQEELTINL